MENAKFPISDEFTRTHAVLHGLDDKDAATTRFVAFLRKMCAKITRPFPRALTKQRLAASRSRICGTRWSPRHTSTLPQPEVTPSHHFKNSKAYEKRPAKICHGTSRDISPHGSSGTRTAARSSAERDSAGNTRTDLPRRGIRGKESAHRNESVSVFSMAKAGNPFVAKKIYITCQFTDKHKKSQPVKTLVDTGRCANVISFSTLRKLGYATTDLIHDSGVPTALTGFAGEDARTLGGIFLNARLGRVTREVPFIVVNDVLTHCILGMPAIDAFDFHIRGRARAVSF